jgi:hypothetical protein
VHIRERARADGPRMATDACLSVAVPPQLDAALGTRSAEPLGVASEDIDRCLWNVQLEGPDGPGLFESLPVAGHPAWRRPS